MSKSSLYPSLESLMSDKDEEETESSADGSSCFILTVLQNIQVKKVELQLPVKQ